MVYSKNYFARAHKCLPCQISDIIKPVKYVPESTRASDPLNDFQKIKVHMAVVLDSYGGTIGIVIMEDVLEALVEDI